MRALIAVAALSVVSSVLTLARVASSPEPASSHWSDGIAPLLSLRGVALADDGGLMAFGVWFGSGAQVSLDSVGLTLRQGSTSLGLMATHATLDAGPFGDPERSSVWLGPGHFSLDRGRGASLCHDTVSLMAGFGVPCARR